MLKSRQKMIVDLIKAKNLLPSQFNFHPETNDYYLIGLKGTDLFFKTDGGGFTMRPGLNGKLESSANAGGFGPNLTYFEKWVDAIYKEIEIGDPWIDGNDSNSQIFEEINEEYADLATGFNQVQLERISSGLIEIQHLLITSSSLSEHQTAQIRDDIRRLEENSSKISAKDWYLLFVGQLFSWLASGFLTPDQPKIIFKMIGAYISLGIQNTLGMFTSS